ncbi:MAG: hypothetical protein GQ564_02470 [Bacteroidales bacterium]|nr:hypothetical protein [Bacteroidales bacterium]
MIKQLWETVELLKQHVQKNLNIIYENEKEVKEFLKEPVSESRSQKLKVKFQENKLLIIENNDFIRLQLYIIHLIDKYRKPLNNDNTGEQINEENISGNISVSGSGSQIAQQNPVKEEPKTYTREEIFDLTISGQIQYDYLHPFIDDNDFLNELMEYFIKTEDYEMCKRLKAFKKEK